MITTFQLKIIAATGPVGPVVLHKSIGLPLLPKVGTPVNVFPGRSTHVDMDRISLEGEATAIAVMLRPVHVRDLEELRKEVAAAVAAGWTKITEFDSEPAK